MAVKRPKYRVIYEVEEIQGTCPVYKVGDRIVLDAQYPTEVVNMKETTAICRRIFDNTDMPLHLQYGSDKLIAYVAGGVGEVRFACPMPGEPWTPCGYVIFRQSREKILE